MTDARNPLPGAEIDALLADELTGISDRLEELGTRLCLQDEVVQRYFLELQEIDRLAQEQRQIARLLRAPDRSLQWIELEHMRHRLSLAIDARRQLRPQPSSTGTEDMAAEQGSDGFRPEQ